MDELGGAGVYGPDCAVGCDADGVGDREAALAEGVEDAPGCGIEGEDGWGVGAALEEPEGLGFGVEVEPGDHAEVLAWGELDGENGGLEVEARCRRESGLQAGGFWRLGCGLTLCPVGLGEGES